MNIRVIENINDPFLKAEWERLEKEADVFPQSTYHWCATWWKHLGGRRKLHVVVVVDEQDRALAIAPLCIERHFGVRVLRSFPVHFGDFYTVISGDETACVIDAVLDYVGSGKLWSWARIEQVVESSQLARSLDARSYRRKRMTGSVVAKFGRQDWDGYLADLSRSFRRNVRSRQRKIDAQFEAELVVHREWQTFLREFERMKSIHEKRWADDNAPHKGDAEVACWREALQEEFERGQAAYYQLKLSGVPAAYRLGFVTRGTYYDWHTSFDPEYQEYHVGQMSIAYMIRHFMGDQSERVEQINFMAGDYGWKLDWSPSGTVNSHYMYTLPSTTVSAAFLNWYHHRLRDRLKAAYHRMMENRLLRAVSRNVILLRQKLAGQR